jgi:hypothetical protein
MTPAPVPPWQPGADESAHARSMTMALYPQADTMANYGQDAPAMAEQAEEPLDHYRSRHRHLLEQHKELSGQLLALLEKDCNRLERECKDMSVRIDTIRGSQPTTNRAY